MTERNERDAHSVVIQELEPSWKSAPKRPIVDRRQRRRDAEIWLLAALLVLLLGSAWWVWLA